MNNKLLIPITLIAGYLIGRNMLLSKIKKYGITEENKNISSVYLSRSINANNFDSSNSNLNNTIQYTKLSNFLGKSYF
jgi:hypothetical protein